MTLKIWQMIRGCCSGSYLDNNNLIQVLLVKVPTTGHYHITIMDFAIWLSHYWYYCTSPHSKEINPSIYNSYRLSFIQGVYHCTAFFIQEAVKILRGNVVIIIHNFSYHSSMYLSISYQSSDMITSYHGALCYSYTMLWV